MEPIKMLLDVCHSCYYEKIGPKPFPTGKIFFISKKKGSIDFSEPKEMILQLAYLMSIYLLDHCLLPFVMFDSTGIKNQNFFFSEEIAFFFKRLCSHQPLTFYRNNLMTSTMVARRP